MKLMTLALFFPAMTLSTICLAASVCIVSANGDANFVSCDGTSQNNHWRPLLIQ